jgi:hypothetical protein
MNDKGEKILKDILKSNPEITHKISGGIIKPNKEQLEAIKQYLDELGMPDTKDYLDD